MTAGSHLLLEGRVQMEQPRARPRCASRAGHVPPGLRDPPDTGPAPADQAGFSI